MSLRLSAALSRSFDGSESPRSESSEGASPHGSLVISRGNSPRIVPSVFQILESTLKKYEVEGRSPNALLEKLATVLNERGITVTEVNSTNISYKIRIVCETAARDTSDSKNLESTLEDIQSTLAKDEAMRLLLSEKQETNPNGVMVLGEFNTNEHLEFLRISLVDDTSKSFMVSVADTASELLQRVIGKILCLGKDLSSGFALWEVPYHAAGKEKKIALSDCPVLIKRSWTRPTKIYFLTNDEAAIKFKPTNTKDSVSPKDLSKLKSFISDEPNRRRSVSTTPSANSKGTLGAGSISVKIFAENGNFRSLVLSKGEKGSSLRRRAKAKFADVLEGDDYSLFVQLDDSEGSTGSSSGPNSSSLLEVEGDDDIYAMASKSDSSSIKFFIRADPVISGLSTPTKSKSDTTINLKAPTSPLLTLDSISDSASSTASTGTSSSIQLSDEVSSCKSASAPINPPPLKDIVPRISGSTGTIRESRQTRSDMGRDRSYSIVPQSPRREHFRSVSNNAESRRSRAIEVLKQGTFRSRLSLQAMAFNEFPKEFKGLRHYPSWIDLANNSISKIPEWFSTDLTNIKGFVMSSNALTEAPSFIGFSKLATLDLGGNKLTKLHPSIFDLPKLKRLYLSYNSLKTIPEDLGKLSHLKELTLAGNNLTSLPEGLSQLSSLRMLDISSNSLTEISPVHRLFNLEELYASSNLISDITPFYVMVGLKTIDLTSNKISAIPPGIINILYLQDLMLDFNPIESENDIALSELDQMESLAIIKVPALDFQERFLARKMTRSERRASSVLATVGPSVADLLLQGCDMENDCARSVEELNQVFHTIGPQAGTETAQSTSPNSARTGGSPSRTNPSPSRLNRSGPAMTLDSIPEASTLKLSTHSRNLDGPRRSPTLVERSKFEINPGEFEESISTEPTTLKRRKYSQKRFATLNDMSKPVRETNLIDSEAAEEFSIESGRALGVSVENMFSPSNLRLEFGQDEYFTNFHGLNHINFLAIDKNLGSVVISVLMEKEVLHQEHFYRVLLKSQQGDKTLWIPSMLVKTSKKSKSAQHEKIFDLIRDQLSREYSFISAKLCSDTSLPNQILEYESRMASNAFKFGVIYAGSGCDEDAYYSNNNPSPEFNSFLKFLGDKIRLKGWPHYCAGLDVNNNRTGEWSIYKRWSTMEIMFHVSTYLPFSSDDPQQIERKKHIGNDIVVIVFQDEKAPPFNPMTIKSFFNHIFIVVRPCTATGELKYCISVASKIGVSDHTPHLPKPSLFDLNADFRKFLFTKMVNAERASYFAPNFSKALNRARLQLLQELTNQHMTSPLSKKIKIKTKGK